MPHASPRPPCAELPLPPHPSPPLLRHSLEELGVIHSRSSRAQGFEGNLESRSPGRQAGQARGRKKKNAITRGWLEGATRSRRELKSSQILESSGTPPPPIARILLRSTSGNSSSSSSKKTSRPIGPRLKCRERARCPVSQPTSLPPSAPHSQARLPSSTEPRREPGATDPARCLRARPLARVCGLPACLPALSSVRPWTPSSVHALLWSPVPIGGRFLAQLASE